MKLLPIIIGVLSVIIILILVFVKPVESFKQLKTADNESMIIPRETFKWDLYKEQKLFYLAFWNNNDNIIKLYWVVTPKNNSLTIESYDAETLNKTHTFEPQYVSSDINGIIFKLPSTFYGGGDISFNINLTNSQGSPLYIRIKNLGQESWGYFIPKMVKPVFQNQKTFLNMNVNDKIYLHSFNNEKLELICIEQQKKYTGNLIKDNKIIDTKEFTYNQGYFDMSSMFSKGIFTESSITSLINIGLVYDNTYILYYSNK
jgi:hypothetical protein